MTDTTAQPAAPAAPEAAPMLATPTDWVAERRAKREAAEPARGEGGKFASRNPDTAEVAEAPADDTSGPELDFESEADTQAADDIESEPLEANADDETADPPEPVEPAIEPPQFWDAEGKAAFAKLSPASQKEVAAYEKQRSVAVAKALQRSTETTKAAEAKRQQLEQVLEPLGEYVDAGEARMKQWREWIVNESAEVRSLDPDTFKVEMARYEQEVEEYNAAKAQKARAEQTLFDAHRQEQARLLSELAPDLVDPKEGAKRVAQTVNYLRELGFDSERIRWISAQEASIAHKARLYDEAIARSKKAPTPKPNRAGPTAAPAGQGHRASSSEAQLKALQSKPNLSQDEFLQMQRLKRKS